MAVINMQIDTKVLQLLYEYHDGVITFANDIVIGKWVILRVVNIRGPRTSGYKYNFDNYFEFVIRDDQGIERIQTWYHNKGDQYLECYWAEDGAVNAIPYFFKNHPVFKSRNWRDFDASVILKRIRECFDTGTDNIQILESIKRICSEI